MRALNLALACETGSDDDPSHEYTVGGVLSEQEAAELMSRLDRDRDGRVCWEDFVEYFESVQRAGGGVSGGGSGPREAWFQQEGELAEKLLQHMELQGGSTARRAWVSTLRRRFLTADFHETGELDRSVLTIRAPDDVHIPHFVDRIPKIDISPVGSLSVPKKGGFRTIPSKAPQSDSLRAEELCLLSVSRDMVYTAECALVFLLLEHL